MKPRSSLALVLAALLVPAAATAAPVGKSGSAKAAPAKSSAGQASSNPLQNLTVGGFIGYETDDISGLTLRADAELPFRALSPQINLSWVGSVGFSHLTREEFGFGFTANILKVIPAARFSFPINPQFTLFGDAGLGLAYVSSTVEVPATFFSGKSEVSDSTINVIMRIGAGGWFKVNEKTQIGAILEFDPYFGDFGASGASSQSTFNIMAGAMFKL